MRLVWQNHARVELREAVRFYRDNARYRIAGDFRDAVVRAAEQLREHPEIGLRIDHNAHRILVDNYP